MNYQNQIYKFCTIFDSGYFTKGLALYYSLERVCEFQLYIFTPDAECYDMLKEKRLSRAVLINLSEVEDDELKKIKNIRDVAEYFWTIKASCISFLFERYNLDLVSYLDADIFFYSSPAPIFDEMGNKSVLITPHNFSPQYQREMKNGIYNAGFISFRNDESGNNILSWWNRKCRDWCYRKKEDGKFGDQMYLNDLSDFDSVHVLIHKGILANWNVQQYEFKNSQGKLTGITEKDISFDVIFFHFHYLKFLDSKEVELGRKYISPEVYKIFYKPYVNYLLALAPFEKQGAVGNALSWKNLLLFIYRKLTNTYNIIPLDKVIEE